MRYPGGDEKRRDATNFVAAEDAARFAVEAAPLLDSAVGVDWYERPGSDVDLAAFTLCGLRRARAGEKGGSEYGDEAVRAVLGETSPEALVWIASRAISYMDENGFPEALERWLPDDWRMNRSIA